MTYAASIMAGFGGAGRAFLAFLLVAFILAPSFDFECAVEGLPAVAASTATSPTTLVEQPQPVHGEHHDPGFCPHGHCHQVSIASLDMPALIPSPLVRPALPLWVTTRALTSATSARLERPPRV